MSAETPAGDEGVDQPMQGGGHESTAWREGRGEDTPHLAHGVERDAGLVHHQPLEPEEVLLGLGEHACRGCRPSSTRPCAGRRGVRARGGADEKPGRQKVLDDHHEAKRGVDELSVLIRCPRHLEHHLPHPAHPERRRNLGEQRVAPLVDRGIHLHLPHVRFVLRARGMGGGGGKGGRDGGGVR